MEHYGLFRNIQFTATVPYNSLSSKWKAPAYILTKILLALHFILWSYRISLF